MFSFFDIAIRKRTFYCFLFLSALLLIAPSVKGFNLRKINNAENLSSSNIFSFYQDEKGFMWIGTSRGVDIYDGKRIMKYSPGDGEKYFAGSRIEKIEQTGGKVWLQTYHGLYKIDLKTSVTQSFDMFNRIAFLDKDSRGNIFLVQGNNSIYYTLKDQEQFEQKFIPDLAANDIADFFIDDSDRLWIFRKNGDNICFSIQIDEQGNANLFPLPGYKHSAGIVYCANEDNLSYFVDNTYTLYEFDTSSCKAFPIYHLKDYLAGKDNITSLLKFHDDYFIGFKTKGLSLLRKGEYGYHFDTLEITGGINCLRKDNYQDMIWVGTSGHGVFTCSEDLYSIRSVLLNDLPLKLRQPINALFVDKENTLWLGSRGDGILRVFDFQPDKKVEDHRMELISTSNSGLRDNTILSFSSSRQDNLWIGSEHGLSYFNRIEKRIIPIPVLYGNRNVEFISDIYERDSLLWISTLGMGIIQATLEWRNSYPLVTVVKQFTVREDDEFTNRFQYIYPENDSILWCMNKGEGFFRLNIATSTWENIRFKGNTINETNVIQKDYHGNYLVGTNFGLVKYGPDDYKLLNEINKYPTNSIYSILPDTIAGYWLSTNRGLILYNTDQELFRTYDHHDGLSILEFNEGSSFKNENDGTLFFGGTNGFVTIRRNYYDEGQHYMPPVYFRTITIRDRQYPVEEFMSQKGKKTILKLSHDENFFSLSFSATDYLNGNGYSYYYKLDSGEKEWTSNGSSDIITFADLHPGNYTLYIKYYNKVLGKESYIYKLNIEVLPPWYVSFWARCIYFLLLLVVTGLVTRIWIVYNRKKKADRLQKMEQKHKEEIYESKLQFFTNISHEFCTPLTLIYGPCNRLMEQKNLSEPARKYTSIIKQNAERLNSLIQDLIEFNRIESGYKKPVIIPVDITALANKLADSFTDMAESHAVRFEKEISLFIQWNSDKDFIVTILLNLLSNAFKYAENEKKVIVRIGIDSNNLYITVSNTGKGIAAKDIPTLFDRYRILQNIEQSDNTSFWSRNGLGLAISYNMVHLLGGTIEVESIPDEWTHFRIKLPYLEASLAGSSEETAVSLPDYNPERTPVWQIPESPIDTSKPTLLVVDDEIEIRWLIFDIFRDDYNVLTAAGPIEASEILKDIHPDLIICDVIMQGTDGLTFSRQVKEDETTAHIPFILLSARQDIEGQTAGLNAGAELYITKPFNVDFLKSSVQRLLERKESLREYFSSPLSSYTLENGKLSHKEHKKFINDILKIINKNLRNKDLSAQLIAEKMNIGLRTFYRKLEEIEEITLAELINNCRLLKAADLLIKTKLTIDEIVFQSGFTNRSTFYRAFSKKYNCTPTEYRKQQDGSMSK